MTMISSDWQSQIFEKKLYPEFGPNGPKSVPKLFFFCNFLKFGSLAFVELAYKDRLKKFVTSRGKTHKKEF